MLFQIFKFELRYWLRGIMVWVFFVILATLFMAATSSDKLTIGGALENTNRNAPYVIQNFYAIAGIFTLLMTTAFVNAAAARDFAHNTWQMVFFNAFTAEGLLTGPILWRGRSLGNSDFGRFRGYFAGEIYAVVRCGPLWACRMVGAY